MLKRTHMLKQFRPFHPARDYTVRENELT